MSMRLFLVRHGLSSFNKKGLIQGRIDESYLTDEGYEQAKLTGSLLNEIKFDQIYSSPLKRAAETAKEIEKCFEENFNIYYDKNLLDFWIQYSSLLLTKKIVSLSIIISKYNQCKEKY